MVVDPQINPLGTSPTSIIQNHKNLEKLGIIITMANKATGEFFEAIVQDYVLSGVAPGGNFELMSPEERSQLVDQRLGSVNKFPSLPETQRKVSALDDMDPPRKWAEAIDPDLPTKTVILRILNSARYGFRSRVEDIDKAVVMASAKTIRKIVTACQIRQIFSKTGKGTIDQFWRHSLATAFYAKLFSLPADPAVQTSQQKTEFARYELAEEDVKSIKDIRLGEAFDLNDKDDSFTSGFLHDVGKITVIMCLEYSLKLITILVDSEAEEAKAEGKLWANSIIEIERFLMKDMDHQVIGSRLAGKWELDLSIEQVIGHHHSIHEQSPPIVKLVALADLAANCLFPYPATEEQHPFPIIFVRIEKSIKDKSGMRMEQAVGEAISQDVFEDLVEVFSRLDIDEYLWELVDFKTFFKLCYLTAPRIKSTSIAFLQQTA
jgi:HD-like signal output (HDOD) protein